MKKPRKAKAKRLPNFCTSCWNWHHWRDPHVPLCALCRQHHDEAVSCADAGSDASRSPFLTLARIEREFAEAEAAFEAYLRSGAMTHFAIRPAANGVTQVNLTTTRKETR